MLVILNFIGWFFVLSFIILVLMTIVTLKHEGEEKRIGRVLFPSSLLAGISSYILLIDFPGKIYLLLWAELIIFIFILTLILPNGRIHEQGRPNPDKQLDERDIMFARAGYKPGAESYTEYYQRRPELQEVDDEIRKMPNLCSPGTFTYHPLYAAAADAAFHFLSDIRHLAEGEKGIEAIKVEPEAISRRLKGLARYYGAQLVGITELKPYHYYSHRGRHEEIYGQEINTHHKYALVFTVEMDYEVMKGAPQIQVVAESAKQYVEGAKIGMILSYYIRQLGYEARNHMDGNYLVVAPLLAQDAGLGEIGRMGILLTDQFGPRVRLGVVTTDLPLEPDIPVNLGIQNFCYICKKCAQTCPSQSIPHGDKELVEDVKRWRINQEKCYTFWRKAGTDCGVCMSTCPYSKPNTLLHKFVRWSIRRSQIARYFFLKADDYLYGKRPLSLKKPNWMEEN